MVAQKGKDLLLKVNKDDEGEFVTVAGLRSRTLAFNAESVDVTHSESVGQWRELMAGAGIRSARISGSGIFKDAESDQLVRDDLFNGRVRSWQVIIPEFGIIEGPFQIINLEFTGQHDRELTFEVSLESAGALTFAESG